ncbi:NlpC/P60 family protein [Nonomuraea sp. CA-218870]|uniref:NlpC/P60 family protein n=1 Tax=Nonomuraea sp. CA-218870 TaxID=3239998 RepID=UPI003D935017
MAEFEAGEVVVPVVPVADGFLKKLKKDLVPGAYKLAQEIGREMQRGIHDGLGDVFEPLKEQARKQRAPAQKDGAEVGGAFASGFKKRLQAALKSLPKVELDADASAAQRRVQELRTQLATLADKRIGVDIDAAAATTQLRTIQAQLTELENSEDIQVRADVTAALTSLRTLDAEVSKLDGRRIDAQVDVDAAAAQAALAGVQASVAALDGRRANIRVDVDAGAALAQLALVSTALAALPAVAAAGLGVGGLAGASAAAAVGVGALAAVAIPSITRIGESLKAQETAQKAASAATSSAASTAAQAAQQAFTLAGAEQRVVDAKRAAKLAEDALTQARIDARRAAEDLANATRNAALSEEDAALSVLEARQRLTEVEKEHAEGKAGELALQRAELAVRQAEQREKEARLRNKRQIADQKAADKAGIEGSAQVIAAKDKIAQADRRLEDAERQLRLVQLQQAAASKQAAAASRGVAAEVVKLSPAAAALAKQWQTFSGVYERWQKRLEPSVLPALGKGLEFVAALLPKLSPLVKGTSDALGGLLDSATKALGGKFWTGFFKDLSTAAPAALSGLGKSFGNIITGVSGMIRAFLPFVPTIVGGIERATAAFAKWGKGLGQSQGFKTFIDYARTYGPMVWKVIKDLAAAGMNVVRALAPLGGTALAGLSGLAGVIASMDPKVLQAVVLGLGGLAAGIKVASTAMGVFNNVFRANPIGLVITALGLLVAGFIYAYQNSETFRNIVQTVLQAVGEAATWVWTNVLQPVFNALVALWQNVVAPAATWLWENVIKPAFDGIGAAVKWAWENLIQPAVAALVLYWQKVLGPVITWLWNNIFKPAFDGIGALVKAAWNNVIKPAVAALVAYWQNILGPAVKWLWENVVKPVWNFIGDAIKAAWEKVIKPAVSALWTFISETLPNGFKRGVELIGKFWDGLKKIASAPVEFVVNTVYNNGIRAVWNAVAKALGLAELPALQFKGFARGGILPGTSSYRQGDDQLVAMRRGEGVYVSEAMRDPYERARLHAVNQAAMAGRSLAPFQGLAGGGIVGDILANGVRWGAEKLLNPMLDQASKLMGDSPFAQMLVGIPKKLVADVITFLEGKEAAQGGPGAQKALAFARQQIGKPYLWGGTGPASFDCSGLTMRAWQAGGRGDIPRTSQQQMGWVKQIGKPVPGALGFPHPGHVWMYVNPNTIIEAPQTGLKVRQVAARAAQLVGVPPTEYDSGGYLPTGHSLVYNGTGAPERVLTDRQWESLAGGTQGGDDLYRGPLVENMYTTPEQSPAAIARELWWLSRGRPR